MSHCNSLMQNRVHTFVALESNRPDRSACACGAIVSIDTIDSGAAAVALGSIACIASGHTSVPDASSNTLGALCTHSSVIASKSLQTSRANPACGCQFESATGPTEKTDRNSNSSRLEQARIGCAPLSPGPPGSPLVPLAPLRPGVPSWPLGPTTPEFPMSPTGP